MKIPSLIETTGERMPDVVEVKLPRGVNTRCILFLLLPRERFTLSRSMNRNRHYRSRSIRQPHICAGESNLHEMLGEITREMLHALMCCGDVDSRRVIVRAEMRTAKSAVTRIEHSREKRSSVAVENDLRSLDHHLELQD